MISLSFRLILYLFSAKQVEGLPLSTIAIVAAAVVFMVVVIVIIVVILYRRGILPGKRLVKDLGVVVIQSAEY